MFNLKDLSVKAKIILSVGVFQILSLIIAILGTMGLSRMEKELSIVSDIFVNIQGNLNDLKFGVDNRRLNLVRAVNADNKADFEREMNQVKAIQKEYSEAIPKIRKFLQDNASKLNNVKKKSEDQDFKEFFTALDDLEKIVTDLNEGTPLYEQSMEEYFKYDTQDWRKSQIKRDNADLYVKKTVTYVKFLEKIRILNKFTSDGLVQSSQGLIGTS